MGWMERIAKGVAGKISMILRFDQDYEELLAYGVLIIVHTVFSIVLIIILGYFFQVLLEVLIISFVAGLLRKYSGGAHATSPYRCAVIGAVLFVAMAILVKTIIGIHPIIVCLYGLFSFLCSRLIIIQHAPVDSSNKPILNQVKRLQLKKKSIIILSIMFGIVLVLGLLYLKTNNIVSLKVISSIATGLIWQSITLTLPGHWLIFMLDQFLLFLWNFVKRG